LPRSKLINTISNAEISDRVADTTGTGRYSPAAPAPISAVWKISSPMLREADAAA